MNVLYVFIGGGLGSVLRFAISLIMAKTSLTLPISTLLSNVIACVLFAGIIVGFQQKHLVPDTYKYLIIVGVCGGLSTFSTFSFETFELFKQGMFAWAITNIVLSVSLCLSVFYFVTK